MGLGDYSYAPNDQYSFSAFVFAIDRATNKSIPVVKFAVQSGGPGALSTASTLEMSSNNFTYDAGNGSTTVAVQSLTIYARIKRPDSALSLTYSMFAINWVLTVFSMITTLVASYWEVDIVVTLLPITVILTIPTIRSIYVDAPFGVYLGAYQELYFCAED